MGKSDRIMLGSFIFAIIGLAYVIVLQLLQAGGI